MPKNWPALILGFVLVIYWGRVLRLVYKFRKQGSSANFAPPERLGQILRIIWYPAVAAWIAHMGLSAYLKSPPMLLRGLVGHWMVAWAAAAVGVAALVATMVCWKKMGKSWRMGINPDEKTQLIVNGPYAYVRHPIYALSSLLMLSTIAAVPSPLMLVIGAIHLSLLQWEARREEKYLVQHHGEMYAEYMRHTGRFVPCSLWKYQPAEKAGA